MSAASPIFRLDLATMPEYVAGFPLPIALTLTNVTNNALANDVPGWDVFYVGRAELTFVFIDHAGKRFEVALPKQHGDKIGDPYPPGRAVRNLFDLSLLDKLPPPGAYTLRVSFTRGDETATSNEARFVLHAATREEAAAAAKLTRGSSWADFAEGNWRAVTEHVPPRAEAQTALHRFVQRSVFGPEPLSAQPLSWLAPLERGLLAPEAEVYKIELLAARKDPQAKTLAAALSARVPGLRDAAQAALEGNGDLSATRKMSGAERGDPPGPIPYRH